MGNSPSTESGEGRKKSGDGGNDKRDGKREDKSNDDHDTEHVKRDGELDDNARRAEIEKLATEWGRELGQAIGQLIWQEMQHRRFVEALRFQYPSRLTPPKSMKCPSARRRNKKRRNKRWQRKRRMIAERRRERRERDDVLDHDKTPRSDSPHPLFVRDEPPHIRDGYVAMHFVARRYPRDSGPIRGARDVFEEVSGNGREPNGYGNRNDGIGPCTNGHHAGVYNGMNGHISGNGHQHFAQTTAGNARHSHMYHNNDFRSVRSPGNGNQILARPNDPCHQSHQDRTTYPGGNQVPMRPNGADPLLDGRPPRYDPRSTSHHRLGPAGHRDMSGRHPRVDPAHPDVNVQQRRLHPSGPRTLAPPNGVSVQTRTTFFIANPDPVEPSTRQPPPLPPRPSPEAIRKALPQRIPQREPQRSPPRRDPPQCGADFGSAQRFSGGTARHLSKKGDDERTLAWIAERKAWWQQQEKEEKEEKKGPALEIGRQLPVEVMQIMIRHVDYGTLLSLRASSASMRDLVDSELSGTDLLVSRSYVDHPYVARLLVSGRPEWGATPFLSPYSTPGQQRSAMRRVQRVEIRKLPPSGELNTLLGYLTPIAKVKVHHAELRLGSGGPAWVPFHTLPRVALISVLYDPHCACTDFGSFAGYSAGVSWVHTSVLAVTISRWALELKKCRMVSDAAQGELDTLEVRLDMPKERAETRQIRHGVKKYDAWGCAREGVRVVMPLGMWWCNDEVRAWVASALKVRMGSVRAECEDGGRRRWSTPGVGLGAM